MSIRNLVAAGCAALSVGLMWNTSCSSDKVEPTPSATAMCMTTSKNLTFCYTGLSECLDEGLAVAPECNEPIELPWCLTEDDAVDGTEGVPCFWKDPSTGDLWYNDGNGYVD